jgi:enoyl-CoA hydratase
MSPPSFYLERTDGVALLRFDRPPVNAIELGSVPEFSEAFDEIEGSADIGALVVAGARDCFSAGLDLKEVPSYSPQQQKELIQGVNRMVARLYALPRPTVAAVNGHAIAGGLILALCCDYRIGVREPCKLGLTEARAGVPFPAAPMAVLRAELAAPAARILTLVALNTDSAGALARGVLDELVPRESLLERALEVARDLASIPRDAYGRIKRQLRGPTLARIEEIVDRDDDPLLQGWLTPETATASASLLAGHRQT